MRLLITFQNQTRPLYTQNQLFGFVYNLIEKAGFGSLHDIKDQYKFFNFSQLFISQGNLKLLISSPFDPLIHNIHMYLANNNVFMLNNHQLTISTARIFKLHIEHPITIKTETPIIIRVEQDKYDYYGIKLKKPYKYFYWRPLENADIPLEPFIKQLTDSVYKKYKQFAGKELEEKLLFSQWEYEKTIDLPYYKNGQKIPRPGTLWKFNCSVDIPENMIQFILDTGLGEHNSQGYGFVNILKRN